MSYFIFAPDLSNRHEISQAVSIHTRAMYNGIGVITTVLLLNDYNIKLCKTNSLIVDTDEYYAYIIVNTKIDTREGTITLNGYTANWLLNKRVFWGSGFNIYSTKESSIYEYIQAELSDKSRYLPYLSLAPAKGLTANNNIYIEGGQLLDVIIKMLSINGYGNKVTWDDNIQKLIFEIYSGKDLTEGIHSVTFSYEQGNVKNLVINEDISEYKNSAYISGTETNGTIVLVSPESGKAENQRYEKWISNKSNQTSKQTSEQFNQELLQKAKDEIKKLDKIRQNFSAEIYAEDLGKKYNLGDIVNCISSTFGVQFKARITSVENTIDVNGKKSILTLGEPNINKLEEMILNA